MKRYHAKKLVLAVDDNPAFAEILKSYIEGETDLQVVHFTSSSKALDFLKKFPFDVACILSDIMMKDMDGFQFLTEVRRLPNTTKMPFFFVSGIEPVVFQDVLAKCDYTGFLKKPLGPRDLAQALLRAVPDLTLDSAA